jgi:predicted DsbA family dithiol-disulfide isomerase
MAENKLLRIDIVSDVMCPWCIIGYKQLAQALKEKDIPHEIHWHPFELNPDMPPEGQNMREHIMEKYGSTPEESEESRKNMIAHGTELGFEFRLDKNIRMHNTFNAHQLIHWARAQAKEHEMKMALLSAHFTHTRNLSSIDVLADIAEEIGLNRDKAVTILKSQRYADEVRQHQMYWINKGITVVPSIIFDGQHLMTGAQGVARYAYILESLIKKEN